jgi:hypothetical protein
MDQRIPGWHFVGKRPGFFAADHRQQAILLVVKEGFFVNFMPGEPESVIVRINGVDLPGTTEVGWIDGVVALGKEEEED